MLVCRHPVRGGLWERAGVWRARCCPQPLQLQLGRRLREEGLRRHPHLLTWMSLPVWHLPGWRGMPDNFLQGESDRFKILPIEVTVRCAQWWHNKIFISYYSAGLKHIISHYFLCVCVCKKHNVYKIQTEWTISCQKFDVFVEFRSLPLLKKHYNFS